MFDRLTTKDYVSAVQNIREKLSEILSDSHFPSAQEASRAHLTVLYIVRGAVQVIRESSYDRLPRQAAALSFQTIFSLIPFLVIGLTFLTQFISKQEVSEITDWLSLHMLPAQAQTVAPKIREIADAVDVSTLGIVGAIGLIIVASTLFWMVTHIVYDIWRVRNKPPTAVRVVSAVVVLLIVPAFAGLSVFISQLLGQIPGPIDFVIPLTVTVANLWLAYRFVPSTKVENWAAIIAALMMGLCIEFGKIGFSFYVARLSTTIAGLYGAIAFIPLTLFWIYILWLLFLFGIEMTYTLQHLPELWVRDASDDGALAIFPGGTLALLAAHRVYLTGGLKPSEIARRLQASPNAVHEVLDRLKQSEVISFDAKGTAVPGKRAAEVEVDSILCLFSEVGGTELRQRGEDHLEGILERIKIVRKKELADMTLADLLG